MKRRQFIALLGTIAGSIAADAQEPGRIYRIGFLLLRAQDGNRQVEAAIRFILNHHGLPNLSIISHSWGSMPACLMVCQHPTLVK
ncbi:MAG TPA: alpha/beta fold hydrolase, partial [Steroidobacteraceae bacterium]|nr:alpha/beta fold hydrolase [Steroidobacteraceae bacterium]